MTAHQLSLLAAGLTVAAAALFMTGDTGLAQKKESKDLNELLNPYIQSKALALECSKACHECQRVCDSCAEHCAVKVSEGKVEHLKTMRACQDCAAFCEMAGRISAREGGPLLDLAMTSCAEACKRCAKQCDEFPTDAAMKACADECRRCEQACRKVLAPPRPVILNTY
jgi:hypothetical protein